MAVEPRPVQPVSLGQFRELARHCRDGPTRVLIAERDKLRQLVGERVVEYHLDQPLEHPVRAHAPGSRWRLWIGTFDRGLIRVHRDRVDLFSRADGLSSNYVRASSKIVKATSGLPPTTGSTASATPRSRRFRRTTGLSEGTPWSVLPASDGSVWWAR